MTCDNPKCFACNFTKLFPTESRKGYSLISSLFAEIVIECHAYGVNQVDRSKVVGQILTALKGEESEEELADVEAQIFSKATAFALQRAFENRPSLWESLLTLLDVYFAQLPPEMVTQFHTYHDKVLEEKAMEQHVARENLDEAKSASRNHLTAIRAGGMAILQGDIDLDNVQVGIGSQSLH